MNYKEGRIGRQETAAAAGIACAMSGMFAVNTARFYEKGNSGYFSSILSALLSLMAALLIGAVMRKKRIPHLGELYRRAFGPVCVVPVALMSSLLLAYAAAAPLIRMLMILCRYVFIEAPVQRSALYFVACILALGVAGLEVIGRTARLFVMLILGSVLVTFVVAAPAFEAFRLFPLLGNGMPDALWLSVTGISRFFPALLTLLICGEGVHGMENAATGAAVAAGAGGLLTAGSQLCLGMLYPAGMLAGMHAPMYRATMSVHTGGAMLRTDKLLLFIWTMGGLIAGGFYTYAGALLYAKSTGMRDVRPGVTALGALAGTMTLLGMLNLDWLERAAAFLSEFGWACFLLPPLLAVGIVLIRRKEA